MCLGEFHHSSQNSVSHLFGKPCIFECICLSDIRFESKMFKCACEGVSRRAASMRQRRVYRRRVLLWQEARLLRRKVSTKFFSAFKSCRFISCSQWWKRLFCYGGPQPRWCKWFHQSLIWNNRFQVCDLAECLLPDCFCSADGTQAPGIEGGKLEVGRKS